MQVRLYGVAALALAAVAFSPMARADGPRPSSGHSWPGMAYAPGGNTAPAVAPQLAAAPLPGPRPSSGTKWPGIRESEVAGGNPAGALQVAGTPAPGAQHWVWTEGYSHGGIWQGGWELVP